MMILIMICFKSIALQKQTLMHMCIKILVDMEKKKVILKDI